MTKAEKERVKTAAWFVEQLNEMVDQCDSNIEEDQKNADEASWDDDKAKYEARVEDHQSYKKSIKRILAGKTFAEDLAARIRKL